ncbi:MAG: uracil-DNA glycosylase [candidate division FCPU426 bacterium]
MSGPQDDLRNLVGRTRAFVETLRQKHPNARVATEGPISKATAPVAGVSTALQTKAGAARAPRNENPKPQAPWAPDLAAFEAQICGCKLCPLGLTRRNFVFGSGDRQAKIVFLGAAPGPDEDQRGLPFQGAAGALLDRIIVAMGSKRDDVYLMTLVKCRTPGGGDPKEAEIEACRPFWQHQLDLIRPQVVCALGQAATKAMLGQETDFAKARGKFHDYKGMAVMPTYSPSDITGNEALKRPVWDDMKKVLDRIKSGGTT